MTKLMTTLTWVLIIYLFTVVITYPFIKADARKVNDTNPELFDIFNHIFLAKIVAFIPLYNLYVGFIGFIGWLGMKIMTNKIKKQFKDHPDPKVREDINQIVKGLSDYNKLD
jgi:hypothetical protein